MAVMLEGGCRVSDMREGQPLVNGTVRIWKQIGRANGAQAISLRIMEFAPGVSSGIRNDGCDDILYLLDRGWTSPRANRREVGTTHVSGWVNLLIDGRCHEIYPATGIYIR